MANVYGYWTCSHCKNSDIRDDKTTCPSCGSPRNKDTKKTVIDISVNDSVIQTNTN